MVSLRLKRPTPDDGETTVARLREVVSPQAKLGAELRTTRMRQGLSLADVARTLRIRQVHLVALEDGRLSDLPGRTYVVGFLRTYGSFLGLDGEALVARFRDESSHLSAPAELNFPEPMTPGSLPAGRLVMAALAVAAIVFGGWYIIQDRANPELPTVEAVPENLTAAVEPVPEPEAIETTLPEAIETTEPEATTATVTEATATALPEATTAEPVATATLPEVTTTTEPVAAAATATTASTDGYVPSTYGQANAGGRVQLRAKAETWVQINGPGDELVMTRILQAGDVYNVPDRADLTLVTGNAGGIEVLVDGVATPPLGAVGEVRRDIRLDPAALKAGQATP